MSVELVAKIKAIDEISDKMQKIGEETGKAMKEINESAEKASFSMKGFITSISGVMTAGYSLYNVYDKVTDAQHRIEKAQYALKEAQDLAKKAQEKYTEVVNKFGEDSPEAVAALDNLRDSQEKVRLKTDELKDKQEGLSTMFLTSIPQAITGTISMVNSLRESYTLLTGSTIVLDVATKGLLISLGLIGGAIAIVGTAAYVTYEAMQETAAFKEVLAEMGMTMEDYNARVRELVPEYGSLLGAAKAAREEIMKQYEEMKGAEAAAAAQAKIEEQTAQVTQNLSATLTDLAMSNEEVITASQETIDALTNVGASLGSLQSAVGGMPDFWSERFGALSEIVSGWASSTIEQINAVKEAFEETSDEVVGGSIWPEMWEGITETTEEGLEENIDEIDDAMKGIRRILKKPFYMEVVMTVNAANIRAQVQKIIAEVLKSVVIEKTSAGAVTSKIRVPSALTTAPTPTPTTKYSPRMTI